MDFCKGDRVRFLGRPDWGPGRVMKDSSNGKVNVCFEYAGEKLLLLTYAKIFKVSPPRGANESPYTSQGLTTLPSIH